MTRRPTGERREKLLINSLLDVLQRAGGSETLERIRDQIQIPKELSDDWRFLGQEERREMLWRVVNDTGSYLKEGGYLVRKGGRWTLAPTGAQLVPPLSEPAIQAVMRPGNQKWYPGRISP